MKVAELIEKLQQFPPDATVVIQDADTNWALHVSGIGAGEGTWAGVVVLAGDYGNEWTRKDPE